MQQDPGSVPISAALSHELLHLFVDPENPKVAAEQLQQLVDSYFAKLAEVSRSDSPLFGTFYPQAYKPDLSTRLPQHGASWDSLVRWMMDLIPGSLNASHPASMLAAVSPPTILSLFATLMCGHLLPNLAWDFYSQGFAKAEIQLCSMLSAILGFDPSQSMGVSTYGGAGTNLYGIKVGIEKAKAHARSPDTKLVIVAGDTAHFSVRKAAAWLGLGWHSVVEVATHDGALDSDDLSHTLRRLIDEGYLVGGIVSQMGSTYDFYLDDVAQIAAARDQVYGEMGVPDRPHIHVDAVIGWVYAFFHDYDMDANPLGISQAAIDALISITHRTRTLVNADSIGIDFHKLGFAPLTSSFFIVRDRHDLDLLTPPGTRSIEDFLAEYGSYEPSLFTPEATRPASGVLAAYANCLLLGSIGWQRLLSDSLANSLHFREALGALDYCYILNSSNPGPAVTFRMYPGNCRGEDMYRRESELQDSTFIKEVNSFNSALVARATEPRGGAASGWLSINMNHHEVAAADGEKIPVAVIKSYITSPYTTRDVIDRAIHRLVEAHLDLS